ncbi:MAG: WD40 repeat domain-containing protein [Candidatus Eremiobacteraeota bacterium]|nr:WD40 repeat domain-containing protein [Candidatus Eremiobacteraeota bacterium]
MGALVKTLEGHSGPVAAIALSPDEKELASGGFDTMIHIWDPASGRKVRSMPGCLNGVFRLAFSPCGSYLVSGSGDRLLRIWEHATGRELRRLLGHMGIIHSLVMLHDFSFMISAASGDKTPLRVWSKMAPKEESPELRAKLQATVTGRLPEREEGGPDPSWSEWGSLGAMPYPSKEVIGPVAMPCGSHLAVSDAAGVVRIYGGDPMAELRSFDGREGPSSLQVQAMALSPDGRTLALACQNAFTGDGAFLLSAGNDGTVRFLEGETGREVRLLDLSSQRILALALSHTFLLAGGGEKVIWVIDPVSGKVVRRLEGHGSDVSALAFSQCGRWCLSGGYDTVACVWETATGARLRDLRGHSGWVNSITMSADGKHVITGSSDKMVRVWDFESGRELRRCVGHTGAVMAIPLTADNRCIVSGGQAISGDAYLRVWR